MKKRRWAYYERTGKRERKKEKEERGGGKSKARIGETEDQKTGKKVHNDTKLEAKLHCFNISSFIGLDF